MTQIPLTIKHTEKDMPLFQIPELNLSLLLDEQFKILCTRQVKLVEDWIKNKRCKCATHDDIVSKKFALDCEHFEKCLKEDKICIEAEKKIERYSSASIYRTVYGLIKKR